MTPGDLFDLCLDAIDRFNRGEVSADEPFIMLTLPRKAPLRGDRIRLFGKSGPLGRVATGKPRDDGLWDFVVYFPAVAVVKALGDMMGIKVDVQRRRSADG